MKNKRVLNFGLILLLSSSMLTGCKDIPTPVETGRIYCNMVYKEDYSEVSKVNISEELSRKLTDEEEKKEIEKIKKEFTEAGFNISDDQVNSMYEAYEKLFLKFSYSVEEVSIAGDAAQVKVNSNYVNLEDIYVKAGENANNELQTKEVSTDEEAQKLFGDLYIQNIIKGMDEANPSSDTKEKTFRFVKENGYWAPGNENFSELISELVTTSK